MLNITSAKPFLIEIDRQIKERTIAMHQSKDWKLGCDIAAHIGQLKELRYQLAMTPERVIYTEGV